jgi:hypothetical protein
MTNQVTRSPASTYSEELLSKEALRLEAALQRLEQRLARQTSGRIQDLRICATDDGIILSGRTSTYYMKQLATLIAAEDTELPRLQNSIEVI